MTIAHAVAGIAAGAVLLTGGTVTVAVAGAVGDSQPTIGPLCATSGPLAGLTQAQATNARTIAAAASSRGGTRAELIAIDVAITESGLRVLANPNDPSGSAYPNQGVGRDHDSLGLFQQRPGWGSAAQRMDPVASTNLFLDALLHVKSWQSLPPQVTAQLVQRSAFTGQPNASNGGSGIVGGNYLAHLAQAATLVTLIERDAASLDCGGTSGDVLSPGGPGTHGLPASYAIPATSTQAQVAVTFALAQLGKPYVWGATGPNSYDCSGLTSQAWLHAGIPIGRTTTQQVDNGTATSASSLAPGDLVLTPGSDGTLAAPGHVGMYIGHGLVVEAPHTGDVVKVVTYTSFTGGGLSSLRHIA